MAHNPAEEAASGEKIPLLAGGVEGPWALEPWQKRFGSVKQIGTRDLYSGAKDADHHERQSVVTSVEIPLDPAKAVSEGTGGVTFFALF